MQYLKIKRAEKQKRADGSRYAVPLLIQKNRKYGEVLREKTISRKLPIIVSGPHDSGKSRWTHRMYEHAQEIWGAKHKGEALFLPSVRPLGAWTDNKHVEAWYEQPKEDDDPLEPKPPWRKVPAWKKHEYLVEYVADTGAVVIIDDAHKLSGRKLDIARKCILPARMWVVSTSQENRIPVSLRSVLLRREHQAYNLSSETAYDVTSGVMWVLAAALTLAGWWEVGLLLGGLQMLGTGTRAAKQE